MIPKLQIPYKCPVFLSLTDSKGESIAEGKLAHSFNSDLETYMTLRPCQNPANYNSFSVHEHI